MLNIFSKFIFFICFIVQSAFAQLVPINETELSNMTGQAFINIDRDSFGSVDFTKLTFGLDVKTSLNSDLLELGRYERSGEAVGSSDIRISDFALGKIDSSGNIIPFEIKDPFIELAFEDNAGKQDLIGVRLGFGGAKGALSGNIESLTGSVNVAIRDTAAGLAAADSLLADLSAVLLAGSPIETDAQLVNASGALDPIRATKIGIPNGNKFNIIPSSRGDRAALLLASIIPGLDCISVGFFQCNQAQITSNNCSALGIATCFNLSDYNTLEVGNKTGSNTFDFAEGMFLSFQTKPVTWKDGLTNTNTVSGAFLNVPNGGLEVTLEQAFTGTDRVRTRYADPYFGGF